jgi:hypothetical protein
MVEISMSGSGEGPVWVTGRGYSTRNRFGRRASRRVDQGTSPSVPHRTVRDPLRSYGSYRPAIDRCRYQCTNSPG